MTMQHPFDQAIALTPTADGVCVGATSPAYANMVGPLGGVTAAMALNAVLQHPALLGEPMALTVYFRAGAEPLAEPDHGWVLDQARAQVFRNGFFDQTAPLWSPGGHLLASSHQAVYYKA